jgi:hypothetical protein
MGRAVLEQQNSRQRPAYPLLAVGAPALGSRHQPGGLDLIVTLDVMRLPVTVVQLSVTISPGAKPGPLTTTG